MDLDDTARTDAIPAPGGRRTHPDHSGSRWEPRTAAPPPLPGATVASGPRHAATPRAPRRRRVLLVTSLAGAVALAGGGVAVAADQGGPGGPGGGGAGTPAAAAVVPDATKPSGRGGDGAGRRAVVNRPNRPEAGPAGRPDPIADGLFG